MIKIKFLLCIFFSLSKLSAQNVTTFAGSGLPGSDDGVNTTATFNYPKDLVFDVVGNAYVVDYYNHKIRKITPSGEVTTFAGSGTPGDNDEIGVLASFKFPTGITIDSNGNLFVADRGNRKIRKITPLGEVSVFAGTGVYGNNNGQALLATFGTLNDLAFDNLGNLFVVEDYLIRKISQAGVVSNFVGSGIYGNINGVGSLASFNLIYGIDIDSLNDIYVSDSGNHSIRKVTPNGIVTTIAGTGSYGNNNGIGTLASFFYPAKLQVASDGNIYVADSNNHTIRLISSNGLVSTFAGSWISGDNDDLLNLATFSFPNSVTIDSNGNFYIADLNNNKIRKITQTLHNHLFNNINYVQLYPNPSSDIIQINILENNGKLEIYDMLGNKLRSDILETTTNKININSLINGIYLFKITTQKGTEIIKIIKK